MTLVKDCETILRFGGLIFSDLILEGAEGTLSYKLFIILKLLGWLEPSCFLCSVVPAGKFMQYIKTLKWLAQVRGK